MDKNETRIITMSQSFLNRGFNLSLFFVCCKSFFATHGCYFFMFRIYQRCNSCLKHAPLGRYRLLYLGNMKMSIVVKISNTKLIGTSDFPFLIISV